LITGIRLLCAAGGIVIAAAKEGKHKTVSQFFSIFAVLFLILIRELCFKTGIWSNGREALMKNTVFTLFFITTFLTLISGIAFLYRNRELFVIK
jgi:phosphatidylglycerophosphate synthase